MPTVKKSLSCFIFSALIFSVIYLLFLKNSNLQVLMNDGKENANSHIFHANSQIPSPRKLKVPYCSLVDLSVDNNRTFECVTTKMVPAFTICIHEKPDYISKILRQSGTWESHILNNMKKYLDKYPSAGLIDIGANLGVYSLYTAKYGRKVVAVEPFPDNYNRLHKSIFLQKLQDKIVLVKNPVSNVRSQAKVNLLNWDNMGAVSIAVGKPCSNCSNDPQTILVTDLLEVITAKVAILKIDIEGHEPNVLQHISKLLERVFIPIIFMEWAGSRAFFVSPSHTSPEKILVIQSISILTSEGFKPYDNDRQLNVDKWETWPFDVTWRNQQDI